MRGKLRLKLSTSNVVGVAIVLGLLGFALMNEAHGQAFTNNQGNINTPSASSSTSQQQPPKLHLVKITSPTKGQQVPIGEDLAISGTSKDNATTPDCKVSVKLNGNSYRVASASGSGGQTDYSNWNFTLTPLYAGIKEGQNKITAKFSCPNNPNLISHNSVNVTGIAATSFTANNNNSSGLQEQVSPSTPAAPTEGLSPTTNGTNPVYSESTANTSNDNNNFKNLSVTVHLDKNSLHPGDKQTLTLDVVDENSTASISGASISGKIAGPSGVVKKVEGTTDDNGKASYSWKVNSYDPTGKYKVKIEVSNPGYENYSGSKSFKVTRIPLTTSTSSNDNSIPQSNSPFTLRHSAESASDNAEKHHHIRHTTHSTIISSFSPYTVTNTDTNTNTNTKTIIHISPSFLPGANANGGSDTNSLDHTLTVTPSSSSDNAGVNTDSNSNQQASSRIGGEKSNGGSANLGNNLGFQTDGLAQKIINDVKNKLERSGIPIR